MSDIQEALEKADNYNPNSVLGKLTKTLAAAYRETKAEADKYYLDLCIKTRTANRERQKHKQWLKVARRLQKELATVKAEYNRLLEVAKELKHNVICLSAYGIDYHSVKRFEELQK